MEELGTSSSEKLLWRLLTPTAVRKAELAGLCHPTCVYRPEAASGFYSELEGLMSSGVGGPWGKEICWRERWLSAGFHKGTKAGETPRPKWKNFPSEEGRKVRGCCNNSVGK